MLMDTNVKYLSPEILVYELSVESAFLNNSLQDPNENPDIDW